MPLKEAFIPQYTAPPPPAPNTRMICRQKTGGRGSHEATAFTGVSGERQVRAEKAVKDWLV